MEFIIFVALGVAAVIWLSVMSHRRRRAALMDKYGDEALVSAIMGRQVWQGMTREQLIDSQGSPAAVDEKVYKTKTKHTLKYGKTGKNRYSRRIEVENGVVVGWSDR